MTALPPLPRLQLVMAAFDCRVALKAVPRQIVDGKVAVTVVGFTITTRVAVLLQPAEVTVKLTV